MLNHSQFALAHILRIPVETSTARTISPESGRFEQPHKFGGVCRAQITLKFPGDTGLRALRNIEQVNNSLDYRMGKGGFGGVMAFLTQERPIGDPRIAEILAVQKIAYSLPGQVAAELKEVTEDELPAWLALCPLKAGIRQNDTPKQSHIPDLVSPIIPLDSNIAFSHPLVFHHPRSGIESKYSTTAALVGDAIDIATKRQKVPDIFTSMKATPSGLPFCLIALSGHCINALPPSSLLLRVEDLK